MACLELRKLYYQNLETYHEEYQNRFSSPYAFHLDFEVSGNPAFYVQTPEIFRLLMAIFRADKKIYELRKALPGKASEQYAEKCMIDEIVLTNQIEGVHSSRKEIDDVMDELAQQVNAKGKYRRFSGLVKHYWKLMAQENIPLDTCEDIRALYDELVLEEVKEGSPKNIPDGKIFRKDMTEISGAAGQVIHRGAYPEEKLIAQMEKALQFLHDENHEPLYRICLFHYLFEYLHPFYDGNGRIGRFIFSYCISEELDPLLAYRISETIKEHITEYYKAFDACNDEKNLGDLTPFLIMMLTMVQRAADDLKGALERRLIRWGRLEEMIQPVCTTEKTLRLYSLLIQAALFSEYGVSVQEVEEHLEVGSTTARNMLKGIEDGLLEVTTVRRKKYYRLDVNALERKAQVGAIQTQQ